MTSYYYPVLHFCDKEFSATNTNLNSWKPIYQPFTLQFSSNNVRYSHLNSPSYLLILPLVTGRTELPCWPHPGWLRNCGKWLTRGGASPAVSGRSCGPEQEIRTLKPIHKLLQKTCKGRDKMKVTTETLLQHYNKPTSTLNKGLGKTENI